MLTVASPPRPNNPPDRAGWETEPTSYPPGEAVGATRAGGGPTEDLGMRPRRFRGRGELSTWRSRSRSSGCGNLWEARSAFQVAVGIAQRFPRSRQFPQPEGQVSAAALRTEALSDSLRPAVTRPRGTGTPRAESSRQGGRLVCHTVEVSQDRRQEANDQPPDSILRPDAPE